MSPTPPRLLFVPVSGPTGMGEYSRALAMATSVIARQPDAQIHFAVSREAPYAAHLPFPATRLPSSPTFHTAEVNGLIRDFAPDVAIFDNAGRTAQLRAAKRNGASVVFVSARPRQRRKAFRWRWMSVIDEHWFAYPRLLAGEPGVMERLKLAMLGRPRLRFLDPILPAPDAARACTVLDRLGVRPEAFIVVVPGGGTGHAGSGSALHAIAAAADRIAEHGIHVVLVGLDPPSGSGSSFLHPAPRLPLDELAELMRHARLVIANGGYTLLQALACDRACIAIPLVGDQRQRIERCVAAGIAVRSEGKADALTTTTVGLLNDARKLESLRRARAKAGMGNGAQEVAGALVELAETAKRRR